MPRVRQAGPAAQKLTALRTRAGISIREMAERLKLPASTYQGWEQEAKKAYFTLDRAEAIAKVLVGLGEPPITADDVVELAGLQKGVAKPLKRRERTEQFNLDLVFSVPEINVLAGAGMGGEALVEAFTDADGNTVAQDVVKADWGIPEAYRLQVLGLSGKHARIIEIRGDSMSPTLLTGDRVMVDTADRLPSPDGLFALFDGMSVIVKRVEHIPNSEPPAFKLISDNPKHSIYERVLEEIHLIGRVVWLARKI